LIEIIECTPNSSFQKLNHWVYYFDYHVSKNPIFFAIIHQKNPRNLSCILNPKIFSSMKSADFILLEITKKFTNVEFNELHCNSKSNEFFHSIIKFNDISFIEKSNGSHHWYKAPTTYPIMCNPMIFTTGIKLYQ